MGTEDKRSLLDIAVDGYIERVKPLREKRECKVAECDQKHCAVCGGHYSIMAYSWPGPCTLECKKVVENDHEPYRAPHQKK